MINPSNRTDELARLLKRCQGYFVTAAIFSLAINLLYLAGPLYMLQVYDRVISSASQITLLRLTIALLVAYTALAGLDAVRARVLTRTSIRLDQKIAPRVMTAIIEQSATQIFFPNPKARAADYIDGFGLTEHEFELVRMLPDTSHCFLVKQPDHSVVARLDLTGMAELKVLAGTERSVRRLDTLRATRGDDPGAWLDAFMRDEERHAA